MWVRSIAVVAVLAAALAACERQASGDIGDGPGGPDAVKVTMTDNAFDPDTLELEAGAEVTIEITNDGNAQHNFTVDDLDLSTGTMDPRDVKTATFTVPDGTTEFHCTFHGEMDGEIHGT